ncbi:MAG: protein tyrosine phosphatase [Verrucomicrobiaceae bacterium]|nr:protein tyrosine phosphatase [Verrucomicrobiaceae bacterium]
MKLLFICSRNRFRSLTAERIFTGIPGYEVRSAGTQPGARVVVTEGMIGWADLVFVMEKRHLEKLRMLFSERMQDKEVVTLGISDDYEHMDPDLVEELRARVSGHIALPGEPGIDVPLS